MKRRDFIKEGLLGAWAVSQSPLLSHLQRALYLQQATAVPQAHFPDLAQYEEAKQPLLAGRFDEALKHLIPAVKERPGTAPYTIAIIYLRMERYAEGIPYALQACRDTPEDIRYRWMLRLASSRSRSSGSQQKGRSVAFPLKPPRPGKELAFGLIPLAHS